MEQLKYILAIESSCDDTGAAVLCNDKVLSNVVAKQEIHELYGGVIPELASRAHQQNIVPVIDVALKNAGISKKRFKCHCLYSRSRIDGVAVGWRIIC